jgi:CubicO group peptidase (beta-lactamase class C family)
MRRLTTTVSAVVTTLLVALPAPGKELAGATAVTPHPRALGAIRDELSRRVEAGELPSVAVGVLVEGEAAWREAFGWADREAGVRASPESLYGLASLGKSITGTAVLALVERGVLTLDSPVAPWLEPATLRLGGGDDGAPVTLRQVLQMTAGIPHGNYTYDRRADAAALTSERLLQHRGIVVFPPGRFVAYSNFTYAVLERLLERATGLAYPDALRREVFEPLGMATAFVGEGTAPAGTVARYDDAARRLPDRYPRPRSSRAMNASVEDLLRYAGFHLGRGGEASARLLSRELLERAHRDRPELPGGRISLGGWGSFELPTGELVLLSNGRDRGVQSTLAMLPESDLAVVVLANVDGDATDDIAFRILDALAPGFLDGFAAVVAEFEAWSAAPPPEDRIAGRWRGSVETAAGRVPLTLDVRSARAASLRLGDAPSRELAGLAWEEGLLVGRFEGRLVLEEEPPPGDHRIDLGLRLDGRELVGYALAIFDNERGSFALPCFARLEKVIPGP